jgi:hypothetical protein
MVVSPSGTYFVFTIILDALVYVLDTPEPNFAMKINNFHTIVSTREIFLCLLLFLRRVVVLDTPIPNFRNGGKGFYRGRLC